MLSETLVQLKNRACVRDCSHAEGGHYDALAAYAKKEHDEDQRPAIKNAIDLSDYDTIFIGYPMWWAF